MLWDACKCFEKIIKKYQNFSNTKFEYSYDEIKKIFDTRFLISTNMNIIRLNTYEIEKIRNI